MKSKVTSWFWGLVLIAAGAIFLAQNLGYIKDFSEPFWMITLGTLSVLFFATYFINGVKEWGWLFPACILAGTTATIALGYFGFDNPLVAAPVVGSIAIPFLVVYALDRKNWWALIPAYVMGFVIMILAVSTIVPGEWMAALICFAIALPFVVVYLWNRSNWWALIPAAVLVFSGLIPVLTTLTSGNFVAAGIMFLIALPFLVVYVISTKNWWALIPAGVMAGVGVGLLASSNGALLNGLMFAVWAVTFGILWLRRNVHNTGDWPKYPAIALGVVALVSLLFSTQIQVAGPVILVLVGATLIYFALRKK